MRTMQGRGFFALAGLLLLSAASARAAAIYDAEAMVSEFGCAYPAVNKQDSQLGANALATSSISASGVGRPCEVFATGTAGAGATGRLSSWSSVLATIGGPPPYFTDQGTANAYASVEFDDLVFSSSDPNATQVAPTLRLLVSGALSTLRDGRASVTVSATGVVSGSGGEDLNQSTLTCDGLFAGCPGSGGVFLVAGSPVALGVPLHLRLALGTGAGALTGNFPPGGASNSSAYANFGDTLEFPTSGPVFDLPQGFTVNSLEAQIVDNQWMGAPVPEPTTALTLALGLVGLAAARRGKRGSLRLTD